MSSQTETVIENNQEAIEEKKIKDIHPIEKIINNFLHRAKDIRFCSKTFIPLSIEIINRVGNDINKEIDLGKNLIKPENDPQSQILGHEKLRRSIRRVERVNNSEIPESLERSLFVNLFSSFDAFIGELLSVVFIKKPELFNQINKELKLSEVLKFSNFDELKYSIMQIEIDNFRRNSYVDQFIELEKRFNIKLRTFKNWSKFIECSQRRNIITHCDGIVSEQYLSICKKEGYDHKNFISPGDRVSLGPEYFMESCELMIEVCLKLGQTLWRKLFPTEISQADTHLQEAIFDFLQNENWTIAQTFGEYAINLPEVSSDLDYKINLMNYAIALKFDGKNEKCKEVLSTVDWSASLKEFKLAENVLLENFDKASSIMKKIGKKGDLLNAQSYHYWPLFKDFRQTDVFLKTYEEIYGFSFSQELQRAVEKAQGGSKKQKEVIAHKENNPSENTEDDILDYFSENIEKHN